MTVPTPESEGARAPRWAQWLLGVFLVAAIVLAYQPAWNAGFIWDDDIYVTENKLLTAPDGLKRIWFSTDAPSQYFPLVYTSFRLERALWGLNPAGYHWVNIILHAASALLLWRLLHVLRVPGAWLGAALFALHPVQVESVAWITERKNVLMGFFFLLAMLAWRRFIDGERGGWKFYLFALVAFFLALASKTTACTLPVAFLIMEWWQRGRVRAARWLQVTPFVALGLAAGLLAMWWERYKQGTQGAEFDIGIIERLLIAARAFWFYLGKLFWPAELVFSYPRWTIDAGQWEAWGWVLACLALAAAVLAARRMLGRGPEVAVAFFAVTLAPMLGFIMLYTFRYTFVADHYQYLACIGPLALVAGGVTMALQKFGKVARVLVPVAALVLLLPLSWRTWQQSRVYQDSEVLWRATIAANPRSWIAHNNLATVLLQKEQVAEAARLLEEVVRLNPAYADGYNNLAMALLRLERTEEAMGHFEEALRLDPKSGSAHFNYANALAFYGRGDEAREHYERALELLPQSKQARTNYGVFLIQQGEIESGVARLKSAIEVAPGDVSPHQLLIETLLAIGRSDEALAAIQAMATAMPNNAAAHNNAGNLLLSLNREDDALKHLQRAAELEPGNAEVQFNLGNAYLAARDIETAKQQYRRAIELNPDYAAARLNLANLLVESAKFEEAVAEYKRVIALQPDYLTAHQNLASVLNTLGRFDEAMEHLRTAWKLEAEARRP